jgi:hypothetical protein
MRKIIASITKPIVDFSALLFPYLLIFYLVLFLLEYLFPGFVSNTFDLNYLLIPIIISGFFSAFAPEKKQEAAPATKSDYALIVSLNIIAFMVLFYKTADQGTSGIIISLAGAVLIGFMSVIILKPDIEPEEEKEEEKIYAPATSNKAVSIYKRKYLVSGSLLLGIIAVLAVFFGPQLFTATENDKISKQPAITQKPIPTIEQHFFYDELNSASFDTESIDKTPIIIMNAGVSSASLSATVRLLQKNNFIVNKIIPTDGQSSGSAVVRFGPEDLDTAMYLIKTLEVYYPDIDTAPLPTDDKIIMVVLGKK